MLETDASVKGLGAVLSQEQEDKRLHPIAYASRALSPAEKNYSITELETLAVVWAVQRFHAYLYNHRVLVLTDHSAVKAILGTPSLSGKHARWWTKLHGAGLREVEIRHRAGRENLRADALSRNPSSPSTSVSDEEILQVAAITTTDETSDFLKDMDVEELLASSPKDIVPSAYAEEQWKDPQLAVLMSYLIKRDLPSDPKYAQQIAAKAPLFAVIDDVLYFVDQKRRHRKRAVVPRHLQQSLLQQSHGGPMSGHFSGPRLYSSLARTWWWDGMYADTTEYCRTCPQCAIVTGGSQQHRPLLRPIPVQRVFQIIGLDIMDLPITNKANQHVIVFQDFLSKWPLVFPTPDQKAVRIVKLLVEEVIPIFGVPEALLTDRGTNLLAHLMQDVCKLLGIKKLNTTAYHPQCDGMVERFNRTLKTMIRKHASVYGSQWDTYLHGLLWAYRNTPHETTGEKPSFLLFGLDCRTPTESMWLPTSAVQPADVSDYREHLMLSLTTARELAAQTIQRAQQRYKKQYDKTSEQLTFKKGDWVLVRFPQEETGKQRKLSRPWHGPYRVLSQDDPDITVVKVYRPQDGQIQIHQSRVKPCPNFPAGFFWYGARRHGPGRPPKWIDKVLRDPPESQKAEQSTPVSPHKEPIRTSSPHPSSNRRYNLRSRPQAST